MLFHITPEMVPGFIAALVSTPLVAIVVVSWVKMVRKPHA